MKAFLKEFKEFALRGNVLDMAVGVIIGSAFSKIVSSLVNDVIMPLFAGILGSVSFAEIKILLRETEAGPIYLYIGQFLQNVLDFLIIAFCIFVFLKAMMKLTRKDKKAAEEKPAAPEKSAEVVLLEEIRDALKTR